MRELEWWVVADDDPLILDFSQGLVHDGANPTEAGYREPDPTTWYDVNLAAAFNLPPFLAPIRLPHPTTLATQARQSELLADLHSLTDEVRKTTVQAATVPPLLLKLAEQADLIQQDDGRLVPGGDVAYLDDLADDTRAVNAWDQTFAIILETTLETADETDPIVLNDFNWRNIGAVMAVELFLSRRDGVPVDELADACRKALTDRLGQADAERQWRDWVSAHGDPTQLLLSQLKKHGALDVIDGVVRLEPLGLWSVCFKLREDGVQISLLPPPDLMTPDHLMLVKMDGTKQDSEDELAAWVAPRGAEQAAQELLNFAADNDATTRRTLITIVSQLGQDAEPAWREALTRVQLRCYAKTELAELGGFGPDASDLPAELRSTMEDIAWLLADSFSLISHDVNRVGKLKRPAEVFEIMARLDHPDAESVLALIGKHADNKQIAKAARRAAYKASTRRVANR